MTEDADYMENSPSQDAPEGDKAGGDDKEKGDSPTFLVNKEAYPEAKPGDMFKMRVEAVHDAEMECSVMKDKESDHEQSEGAEESQPSESPMPSSMMD